MGRMEASVRNRLDQTNVRRSARSQPGRPLAVFTVDELLAAEDFGLKLIAGGPESRERPVTGSVLLDTVDESTLHQLDPGVVVLAVGDLVGASATDPRLVDELSRMGVSALGWPLHAGGDRVPPALLKEALRAGLAVISIPPGVSCDDLMSFVEAERVRSDAEILRRALSAQAYLMDALTEARPEEVLVRRLAWLVEGEALLLNDGGHVVAATGTASMTAVWPQIRQRPAILQQFRFGAWHVTSVPVSVQDCVHYWLVTVSRRHVLSMEPWRSVLVAAERLMQLIVRMRGTADADEQALRASLLAAALDERDSRRLAEIARRAERFGITFAEPCRVAVAVYPRRSLQRPPPTQPAISALAVSLRSNLAAARTPYLLAEQPDGLIALVQGDCRAVDDWVGELAQEGVDLVAGVGRAHQDLTQTHDSALDAHLAVQQIDRRHGGAVLRFDDCDLARWVIGGLAPERLGPKVQAILADIKADERLYTTLLAYFDADLDVRRAASALHLHVNSVRYRLGKIEALLGRPMTRIATLADLYIAVTAERLPKADAASSSATVFASQARG